MEITIEWVLRKKKTLFFSLSSKQKCIKLKNIYIYIYIYWKKWHKVLLVRQKQTMLFYLLIVFCEKE